MRVLALGAAAVAAAVAVASPAGAGPRVSLLAPRGACGPAAERLRPDRAAAVRAIVCLTNYARTHAGLAPLRPSATLTAAGNAKLAADVSCEEFSHTPCGRRFEDGFAAYLKGATSYGIGENIAWGSGSAGTARRMMDGWLHSPAHRENILRASFEELGVGYVQAPTFQGHEGVTLWSQEFGRRRPLSGR